MDCTPPATAVHVRAPATSANLGPGFDALGLALDLDNEVWAWPGVPPGVRGRLHVHVHGEGEGEVPSDESNLVARAFSVTRAALGSRNVPDHDEGQGLGSSAESSRRGDVEAGFTLCCHNRIPHGRGLGSSAAAICAGIAAAQAVSGRQLSRIEALQLATELEGHPDNVAACLYGGLTLAWREPGQGVRAAALDYDAGLLPTAFVPATRSHTKEARAQLPSTVSHEDAAANGARVGLLVAGLSGHREVLFTATRDTLHEPYRLAALPEAAAFHQRLRRAHLPAVLSGSGPTLLVLADRLEQIGQAESLAGPQWQVHRLHVARDGAGLVSSPMPSSSSSARARS